MSFAIEAIALRELERTVGVIEARLSYAGEVVAEFLVETGEALMWLARSLEAQGRAMERAQAGPAFKAPAWT